MYVVHGRILVWLALWKRNETVSMYNVTVDMIIIIIIYSQLIYSRAVVVTSLEQIVN